LQLAGVGIKRQNGAGVEIVAGANVAIIIGPGIAGAPVNQTEIRIEGAGEPGGAASALPRSGLLPGLVAGLAGRRDGIEAPGALPGRDVIRVQKSADPGLGARDADDHLILYD